eukprot:2166991-Rhodomonas_salina.2
MDLLELDTVVDPSVLEAPPTALWTTAADDFAWPATSALLIFLEWVPPDQQEALLSGNHPQNMGIIARCQAISSDLEQTLDEDWIPNTVNCECHFLHKANWWSTGNQGLPVDKTTDVFTVWTRRSVQSLPLQRAGFQPPLSLIRLTEADLQSYFDNTPSG